MNTTTVTLSNAVLVPLALVALCGGVLALVITGKPYPFSTSAALILILGAGMLACMGGIGQVAASTHWNSPVAILGYLLGAAILIYAAAVAFGFTLPFAGDKVHALIVIMALIALKLAIGLVTYFFHLLS